MITLTVGETYPVPVPDEAGAHVRLLIRPGNYVQLVIPGMTGQEETAINSGLIKVGLMYEAGAMLILFQFHDAEGLPLMFYEAPFDIKAWPSDIRRLPDVENSEQRLPIDIHAIDENGIFRALRHVFMPPDMTLKFLLAVQDQMAALPNPERVTSWLDADPKLRQYEGWILEN
ncbi:conserved hypothetical protein [Candidatus Methylobacter favarea]|uniref:Uncharacterized protein n=1 Tax=Candidatus Methylobacter favarea TaxID=2707345 RepID=A0A8S0Y5X3_9GAMM|nr:hypothetical protein [Candidatus Methylobacter favarea]CAA9889980.1 conserved hypothetical protein [Candidatus Methylobacter favarea]